MRVAFAIAPWSHSETYPPSQGKSSVLSGKFGMLGGATPPMSLLYISSYIKALGNHETRFVDGFFVKGEQWIQALLSFEPDLIGLWSTQFSWERTKRVARELKEQGKPGLKVMVGGTFINASGAVLLEDPEADGIDYLVVGEGEDAVLELCQALGGERGLGTIKGLVWRQDGEVMANETRPWRRDLDSLPFPDYDLLDLGDYAPAIGSYKCLPSVNLMTVRGCAFCHAANSLRERSLDNVLEEIKWLQGRFGVRHLLLFDETFTFYRERVIEFCRRLEEERIKVRWTCNSRVDTIDPELIKIMKRAGCWRLQFGAESGVQKQLDTLYKQVTPEDNRRAVVMTKRGGLDVFASFMLGIPGETYEEGLQTIKFAKSLPLDYCNFLNFMPLAGTPFYKDLDRYGTLSGPTAFHLMSFVPHSMTREQLADLMVRGPKEYYFRPSYLIKRFLAQRSLEDVKRNMRGFFAFIGGDAKKDFLS